MKIFLTYLMAHLIENSPTIIDYVYVYDVLSIINDEEIKVKEKIKEEIKEEHKKNFEMEVDYTKQNLKEIGIDKDLKDNFKKYQSKKIDKLVDKNFKKLDSKIKNQVLNMLNTKDTTGVVDLIKKTIKNEKKSQSLVNSLMRVFRTESTIMRSQYKLDLQEDLEKEGIKVKRRWVHTLYNPTNVILDNYTPREEHLAMNGQLEDSNGYFHGYNYDTKAPGMFGIPEEDINCRCDVDFVLDE